MNRRKAKKKMKKKWNIEKWPGNMPPFVLDSIYKAVAKLVREKISYAIYKNREV